MIFLLGLKFKKMKNRYDVLVFYYIKRLRGYL